MRPYVNETQNETGTAGTAPRGANRGNRSDRDNRSRGKRECGSGCAALAGLGVFTLAEQASDEIEHLALFQEKGYEAAQEVGKSKARQAYYLAATYPPPTEFTTFADDVRRYLEKVGALT